MNDENAENKVQLGSYISFTRWMKEKDLDFSVPVVWNSKMESRILENYSISLSEHFLQILSDGCSTGYSVAKYL